MDSDSLSRDQDIIDILKGLESGNAEYPPALLAERRKLFLEQLENRPQFAVSNNLPEKEQKLLEIFRSVKALEPEYPRATLARRRSLYKRQVSETLRNTIWHVVRSSITSIVAGWVTSLRPISMKSGRTATLAVGIAMIVFAAFALYGNTIRSTSPILSQNEISTATPGQEAATPQAAIICADGDQPPLCIAVELDKSQNVAYTGNGKARPAVAKDSGNGQMHSAAHINDGLYGPGASWVSKSPNSWIKIDLGTTTIINTVTFGRDRLGTLNDGDPGRFVIAVAASDDVYANGDSSNDEREYVQVFDSEQTGFDGTISGAQTVIALFDLQQARFIKITFENAHTAVDEVEAFISDPALAAVEPTRTSPREEVPSNASTALPANTPRPSDTATIIPIDTLPPTDTVTPVPTDPPPTIETPTPIDTPTPIEPTTLPPTDTPGFLPSSTPLFTPTADGIPSDGQT